MGLSAALFLAGAAPVPCDTPQVHPPTGPVCGFQKKGGAPGAPPRIVSAFLGIPYAQPPTEDRRFRPPEAVSPWKAPLVATTFGPACPQKLPSGVTVPTSEDCLTLNVWSPDPAGRLPVLVFLYGGSFLHGGSAAPVYDGANLAAAGPVVVVTLNYRLGALGFLAGLDTIDGNFGILDQQLALRWVQENISAFGGDPERVTLFGQSAGAMSVGIHLDAPSSQALFRAAILESNPYGIPYKTQREASGYARALVRHLDCRPMAQAAACLRTKPADEIVAAQGKLPVKETFLLGLRAFVPWGPVIDSAPLVGQPNRLPIKKPVILGTNRDEGALFVAMEERAIGPIGPVKYAFETDIAFGTDGGNVRRLYESLGYTDPVRALSRMVSDDLFTCANKFMLTRAKAPAWGYQFTHVPSFSIWPHVAACAPETKNVCHAAELPFVFGNPYPPQLGAERASFTAEETALSAEIIRLWTGFATTLEPPPTEPPWPAFTKSDPVRLILSSSLSTRMDLEARCRVWDAYGYDRSGPLADLF